MAHISEFCVEMDGSGYIRHIHSAQNNTEHVKNKVFPSKYYDSIRNKTNVLYKSVIENNGTGYFIQRDVG